jgi:hypothetical protein
VWPRPRRRGASIPRQVTVYVSDRCTLCERALEVVQGAQRELEFVLDVVAIDGDDALESRYRELIPVVAIDGRRTFTYFVDPQALRERLATSPG